MADINKTSTTKAGNDQVTDNKDQAVSSELTDTAEIKASDTQRDQEPINIEDYPVDDNGNHVVPDALFDDRYKELPQGTVNESKTWRASSHGKLKILTAADRDIQVAGGKAVQATLKQRRSLRESLDYILSKHVDNPEQMIGANTDKLPKDCTLGDLLTMSMVNAAILDGDTKAATFVRDTAGEKPVDQQEISANVMTDADRALLAKVSKRVDTTED